MYINLNAYMNTEYVDFLVFILRWDAINWFYQHHVTGIVNEKCLSYKYSLLKMTLKKYFVGNVLDKMLKK